jgi:hypothetical protein
VIGFERILRLTKWEEKIEAEAVIHLLGTLSAAVSLSFDSAISSLLGGEPTDSDAALSVRGSQPALLPGVPHNRYAGYPIPGGPPVHRPMVSYESGKAFDSGLANPATGISSTSTCSHR